MFKDKHINAKDEFVRMVGSHVLIAADLRFDYNYDQEDRYTLYKNFNQKEYDEFLKFLDRKYDNGYGGQILFGTIWCENGVWLERREYDGSEWYEVRKIPEIPKSLKHERRGKIKRLKINIM